MLKNPKSECPDVWIRLPRHRWPKFWASIEDLVVLLKMKFIWTPCGRTTMGMAIRESSIGIWMGKSTKLRMSVCSPKTRIILVGKRG